MSPPNPGEFHSLLFELGAGQLGLRTPLMEILLGRGFSLKTLRFPGLGRVLSQQVHCSTRADLRQRVIAS